MQLFRNIQILGLIGIVQTASFDNSILDKNQPNESSDKYADKINQSLINQDNYIQAGFWLEEMKDSIDNRGIYLGIWGDSNTNNVMEISKDVFFRPNYLLESDKIILMYKKPNHEAQLFLKSPQNSQYRINEKDDSLNLNWQNGIVRITTFSVRELINEYKCAKNLKYTFEIKDSEKVLATESFIIRDNSNAE